MSSNQVIACSSLYEFVEVCAGLACRGIGFHADAGTLEITLNGSF